MGGVVLVDGRSGPGRWEEWSDEILRSGPGRWEEWSWQMRGVVLADEGSGDVR